MSSIIRRKPLIIQSKLLCHTSQQFRQNCFYLSDFFTIRLPITKPLCYVTKSINTIHYQMIWSCIFFQFKRLRRQKTFSTLFFISNKRHFILYRIFSISLIECSHDKCSILSYRSFPLILDRYVNYKLLKGDEKVFHKVSRSFSRRISINVKNVTLHKVFYNNFLHFF